jgi:hypothetical protein
VTKLVVTAVLVLAAVAAADAFRAAPRERPVSGRGLSNREAFVVHHASSGLVAAGSLNRKRVLRNCREYLSAKAVDAAFPVPLENAPFDIAYVAGAADGTVALAVYKFPPNGPARAALELWRGRKLLSAFPVPEGVFAGGLGFAEDGRLVAALSSDGLLVHLFTRDGRPAGREPATSW